MATTAQTLKPFNMVERKEPTLVKFADGERVHGLLVGVELIEIDKKRVVRYVVQDLESGELSAFLGTYQINAKLRRDDVGRVIDVRYEGTDPNIAKNGNPMRRFKIMVSDILLSDAKPGTVISAEFVASDDGIGF
jgi:hypothetical protein